MRVLSHDNTRVVVEVDGVVLLAEQCVDRYQVGRNWPIFRRALCVEIWELPDGGFIRLSKEAQDETGWVAEPWV